jgi:hypothetical protein
MAEKEEMQRFGERAGAKEAPAAGDCTWRMQIQRWNRRKEGTAVETGLTKRWKRAEGDLEKSQVPGVGWNAMFTDGGWCLAFGGGDGQETIRLQIADAGEVADVIFSRCARVGRIRARAAANIFQGMKRLYLDAL